MRNQSDKKKKSHRYSLDSALIFTYFLPKAIIPYSTPVVKINPEPNMLLRFEYITIGGTANLEK